jgi:hypothetical protein
MRKRAYPCSVSADAGSLEAASQRLLENKTGGAYVRQNFSCDSTLRANTGASVDTAYRCLSARGRQWPHWSC